VEWNWIKKNREKITLHPQLLDPVPTVPILWICPHLCDNNAAGPNFSPGFEKVKYIFGSEPSVCGLEGKGKK
jgi:hypothetical protein